MASVPTEAPALPWATAEQPRTTKEQHEELDNDLRAVSIDQLGLSIGDRIEVMWQVHPDEGEPMERWWGASITAAEPSTSGSSQPPAYKIKYDAWPDGGFEEEDTAEVALMPEHRLMDLKQQEVMAWRREGEDYSPPDGELEDAADDDDQEEEEEGPEGDVELDEAEGGTVSLQQLASSIDESEVAAGEADMLGMVGAMAPAQQMHMAAGYREFMDNFKQFLAAKAAASTDDDGGVLITTADVEDFKAMMMTQAAQRGRLHRPA